MKPTSILLTLFISLMLFLAGCGGGGGGTTTTTPTDTTTPPSTITSATLTLSIVTQPTTPLGELEVDITLPTGVVPSQLTATANANVYDPSASITMISSSTVNQNAANYPVSSYNTSTHVLKLVIINLSSGQGDGAYARVNCTVQSGTTVTTASFPATATVVSAATAGSLTSITPPSSVVTVPIAVSLQ